MLQKRGLVWLSRPASASWVCVCAESGVLRGGGGVSEAPGTYCPLGFWGCRLVGERKGHIPPPPLFLPAETVPECLGQVMCGL